LKRPPGKAAETETLGLTEKAPGRRLVPAIVIAVFALSIASPTLTVLTREIATTFFGSATQATVGITAQLSTITNAAQVVTGVLMSFLAIRFGHKSLLMTGILLQLISAAGAFLAPNFFGMQVFFAIDGIGSVMLAIAAITLIGDFVPQNRKAKTISYILAAAYLALFAGARLVSFVADLGTWRYAYLLLALPAAAVALAVSYIGISSASHAHQPAADREKYIRSFKQVLLNKSAAACLVGGLFFSGAIGLFAINFFRQQFWLDLSLTLQAQYASYIVMVSTLLFAAGSLVANRLANKFGVKTLTVAGALGDGVFTVLLFLTPDLWMSLAFNWLHVWFATTAGTGLACLALDQAPKARGTMMSLQRVFGNIGNTIGPAVGGALLVWASYQALGFVLGIMSIVASAIILFIAKDPTRRLQEGEKTKIQDY
jgi:DHA1 family inner membrane transport protein